jgi:predicted HTH transcriptional regulator
MTRNRAIVKLVAKGESKMIEFNRSTGDLREALQTLCAFANGSGGKVVIGVKPSGQIVGQQVSEQTLHEIAAARDRIEPPVDLGVERVDVGDGRQVLVLAIAGTNDAVPCTYDGRPYERVGNTTRVEVWSAGRYPTGITAEMLTRAHPSVQRNPLIAEVFYRAGLIEKWGRGTNRVAEMCKAAGVAPPEFTEIGGAAVVTFRTDAGQTRRRPESQLESRPESQLESRLESQLESRLESQLESRQRFQPKASEGDLEKRVVGLLENGPLSRSELSRLIGQRRVSGQLHVTIKSLLSQGLIAYTVPEKPGSRLQKYQLVKPARPQ